MLRKVAVISYLLPFLLNGVLSQTWELVLPFEEDIRDIQFAHDDESLYFGTMASFPDIYGSLYHWNIETNEIDTLFTGISVTSIALDSLDANTICVALSSRNGTTPGIIKSLDGGREWAYSDSGILLDWETWVEVIAIDPMHPGTMYAGTAGIYGGTMWKSINGGRAWSNIVDDEYVPLQGVNIESISLNLYNTNTLYVSAVTNGQIHKSVNGGASWSLSFDPYWGSGGFDVEVVPDDTNIVFAAHQSHGLFKSMDAGETWQEVVEELLGQYVTGIITHIDRPGEVIVFGPDIIFLSNTNGSTWQPINSDQLVPNVRFIVYNHTGTSLYCHTEQGLYSYDLPAVNIDDPVNRSPDFKLHSPYPNPFNPITTINYDLTANSFVTLVIYDLAGREVRRLVSNEQVAGYYRTTWNGTRDDGNSISTGVYFARLQAGEYSSVVKMVYLR
ncbi:MAG: T9SS type A sorting domain-containing protein [Candidatus Marinimicrobia bacterium]|nr:T9SS type A sorting domain-containing protein [Candidatus Neomarinimicrobiota bacterium]